MSAELIHYHPENRKLFEEIEDTDIFSIDSAENYEYLRYPSGRPITFMADHITDKDLEIYVEYIPDHPRNLRPIPDFRFPAFKIRRDLGPLFPTRFGNLPQFVVDATETEYLLSTQYYLNGEGQGIRCETIDKVDERWMEEGIPRLAYRMSEKDSRKVSLEDEDRKYIKDLLVRYRSGEFAEGDYIQDSSII